MRILLGVSNENTRHEAPYVLGIRVEFGTDPAPALDDLRSLLEGMGGSNVRIQTAQSLGVVALGDSLDQLHVLMQGVPPQRLGDALHGLNLQGLRTGRHFLATGKRRLMTCSAIGTRAMDAIEANLLSMYPDVPFIEEPDVDIAAAVCRNTSDVPVHVLLPPGMILPWLITNKRKLGARMLSVADARSDRPPGGLSRLPDIAAMRVAAKQYTNTFRTRKRSINH